MSEQVQGSLRRAITWLDDEIQSLRRTWMELVQADQKLSEDAALTISVPNIGPKTVIPLLSELPEDILCSKGIVGLAGLAPRRRKSGTSLNASDRTSRACQTRLKAALYMPAIQALKTSPDLRAFYDRLLANGKHPKQAIVAVMRKILLRVLAVLKRRTPWQKAELHT